MKKDQLGKIQSLLLHWSKETENMMKLAQKDPLLQDSEQSTTLKHYYQVLNEITQYANQLFDSNSCKAVLILKKLHDASNKFGDQKGQKGYPKVIHALNPYEIVFAHQYLYYTQEIFEGLSGAADEFKEKKLGKFLGGMFSSMLNLEQILKHAEENHHKLKSNLPQILSATKENIDKIQSPAFVIIEDEKHALSSPVEICLVNLSADSGAHRLQLNVTPKEIELLSYPVIQRTEINKIIYDALIYKICASVNFVYPMSSNLLFRARS